MRRRIVGVIGGDEETAPVGAGEVGGAVARAGLVLCTGGLPAPGRAVKNAAMRGAVDAVPEARTIGFLPGAGDPRPGDPRFQLSVGTGLSSTGRDAFTGLTPDAMVVFPGSRGTLTELAFAWARGTPVWLWRSREFLAAKRRWHEVPRDRRGTVREQMLDALAVLPAPARTTFGVAALEAALAEALDGAPDAEQGPDALVRAITARLDGTVTDQETGYPGRGDDPASKPWFEREVVRVSEGSRP